MTVLEKITLQKQNPLKAILFKEGIFYKAYNEGAFLLRSKNYKVAVKAYKKIETRDKPKKNNRLRRLILLNLKTIAFSYGGFFFTRDLSPL